MTQRIMPSRRKQENSFLLEEITVLRLIPVLEDGSEWGCSLTTRAHVNDVPFLPATKVFAKNPMKTPCG